MVPTYVCITPASGGTDLRGSCIAVSQGLPHRQWHLPVPITWMLPAVGIHHLDYSQASPFQKPVGLMDEMASPKGSVLPVLQFCKPSKNWLLFQARLKAGGF